MQQPFTNEQIAAAKVTHLADVLSLPNVCQIGKGLHPADSVSLPGISTPNFNK